MPAPPSTSNYQTGGVIARIGGMDLGNIVSMEIDASDIEILEHFTARTGARQVDLRRVVEKNLVFTFELDEHAAETYRKYFMGGNTGLLVDPLTQPLVEWNCSITYLNETATIWTYSHTRVNVAPSDAMDFGDFDDWATLEVEVKALLDTAQIGRELGRFTFVA